MTYELVPPDGHRRNMAKRVIQTFKDHLVGVLSGCASSMPIHLWCKLLPQVKRQLLLLRQSRVHPNLAVYVHVYEQHGYNCHPSIPIGMEALVHNKPHKYLTDMEHCIKAFVLGTSIEHYRCWQFWTPSTCATCISSAAFFKHKYLPNPTITVEAQVIVAVTRLTDTLQGIRSPIIFTSTLQALSNLHNVFHKAANPPGPPPLLATTSQR